jgi:hypothetical protein
MQDRVSQPSAPSYGGKGLCPDSRASRRCRPDPGNLLAARDTALCPFIYCAACIALAVWLSPTMLRRLHRQAGDMGDGKLERKRSKRQRIAQFFKPKRLQPLHHQVPVRLHAGIAIARHSRLTARV